jgi:phytol kinase
MGLFALSLPWLFTQLWPIIVLAVTGTAGLLVLRLPAFRAGPGAVLGSVERSWSGEVCFSAGIATLFALHLWDQERQLVLFVVPLLLLTIADAAAALGGVRYGRRHYASLGGSKSLEGSTAFLLAALPCSLVPLLVLTDISLSRAALMSSLLSASAMVVEAISAKGLDNLAIPVCGFVMLRGVLGWSELMLLFSLLAVALLIGARLLILLRYPAVNLVSKPSSARSDTMSRTATRS